MDKETLGLYIHVSFCTRKCPYCSFYSVPNEKNLVNKYIAALCKEIQKWGKKTDFEVDTIYFGGGTPSVLKTEELLKIIFCIKDNFKIMYPEVTIEINPGDYKNLDFEKLCYYGVNRISLGAQAINDSALKILGRRHSAQDITDSIEIIKNSKIKNISLDLIIGSPEQKTSDICDFIYFCKENNIPHISSYILKIEENTPYYFNKDNLVFYSEDKLADFYFYTCAVMRKFGYFHYEISNFSKKGFESRHNLKYWNLDNYLGLGPSAHSLFCGKRFYYANDLSGFIMDPKVTFEGDFEPEKELIMLSLRTCDGLTNQKFKNKLGKDIPKIYFERAKKFENYGFLECKNDSIKLTEKGFLVSNSIISEIL